MSLGKAFEKIVKLLKKRAELRFKAELGRDVEEELGEVEKEIEKLKGEVEETLSFFQPFEEEIKSLEEKIEKHTFDERLLAVKKKQGSLYELMKRKAELVNRNVKNAELFGALVERLMLIEEEKRKALVEAIKKGSFEPIEIDEENGLIIAKFMSRLGMDARYKEGKIVNEPFPFKEAGVELGEVVVYLPESVAEKAKELEKKLREVLLKIQVKNAERQIKHFSREEMEEFEKLQKEYLELLKEREKLIEKYKDY